MLVGVSKMKKEGFTLIELLVVIAIIALLLSIVMPALNKVKMKARSVVCMSNMRQQSLIFNFYSGDNNGLFPDRGGWYPHYVKYGSLEKARNAMDPYVEEPDITICPALASYKMDAGDIFKDPYASWLGYGGWATDDPGVTIIAIGYTWFFNFVSPASGATATFVSGERPWPNRQIDAVSSNVLAAHLITYTPGSPGAYYEDWGHEASSKGRIFVNYGDDPDAFTSQNAPILYGDGSVISQPASRFRKRATVTNAVGTTTHYYY